MSDIENWNHEWFGVWRESGTAYAKCPSIKDFIDDGASAYPDSERIAEYLATAQIVATTSRLGFPCVVTGKKFSGSLSYRTDGEWLWPDDLAYYVREHHVRLPKTMLQTIRKNDFKPLDVSADRVRMLERPPIG